MGVWKRKFSWTISGTPARPAACTIAMQSAMVGASGFCTMIGTRCAAASSTSGRCDGMVVAMSTKSSVSAANSLAASPYQRGMPNAAAAASALAASVSQTATRRARGIRSRHACRWFCAKKPQPISAPSSISH